MKIKPSLIFLFFSLLLVVSFCLFPLIQGVGLSPPQLRVENAPVGVKTNVATLVVTNTGNTEPAYLLFKISCLEKSRENKLRVICTACNRDVGIQRGDLIFPAKIIKMNESMGVVTVEYKDGKMCNASYNKSKTIGESFTVGDYVLIGNTMTKINFFVMKKIDTAEALLNDGYCPFCGASEDKLIFYDLPPGDVVSNVTLSSVNYPLEPYNGIYKTVDKLSPNAHVNVDISVNIPNKNEYYGQHWEIRIMATSATDLSDSQGMAMIYGAETKFLVDTSGWEVQTSNTNFEIPVGILGAIGIMVIVIICIGCFFIYNKRKKPITNLDGFFSEDTKEKSGGKIL
jgi:hypothetical protein